MVGVASVFGKSVFEAYLRIWYRNVKDPDILEHIFLLQGQREPVKLRKMVLQNPRYTSTQSVRLTIMLQLQEWAVNA